MRGDAHTNVRCDPVGSGSLFLCSHASVGLFLNRLRAGGRVSMKMMTSFVRDGLFALSANETRLSE